ncbi:MAG: 3-hydroxybutyryl-CoA dehydrogenase, partial [Actinobacteria bacterium]|nr:3-hydroxybutyryl-CoA dehydrogenase [Actinomycetota bacterium]
MQSLNKVAVVGGGLMGSGIAELVASSGIPVIVRDVNEAALAGAGIRIAASLNRAVEGGKLAPDDADEISRGIRLTTEMEDIAEADLVIEAVPENAGLKAAILGQVAGIVSEDALIASNTSSIPIAQLAAGLPRPERVLGLHFFSPVPVMGLIEIVVALDTSEETVAAAQEFSGRLGKRAIVTKDRSG